MTLEETLKLLRANEVRSAKFHADGSIAKVVFKDDDVALALEALETDRAPSGDAAVPDPYTSAFEILERGRTRRNGGES